MNSPRQNASLAERFPAGGVPSRAVFNIGVAITGLMLILFGIGLHRDIDQGKGSKAGLVFLALAGISLIGTGYFHCNQGCTNIIKAPDFFGKMHMLASFLTDFSFAFSPILFFFLLKKDPRWGNYKWVTLAAGILANIPGIFFWITMFTTRIPEWEGLIQRAGLLFPFIWVEVMAIRLFRFSNDEKRET